MTFSLLFHFNLQVQLSYQVQLIARTLWQTVKRRPPPHHKNLRSQVLRDHEEDEEEEDAEAEEEVETNDSQDYKQFIRYRMRVVVLAHLEVN